MKIKNPREASPVEVTFSLIGGKYKGAILWYLAQKGPLRFGELSKYLPPVNPKMLTAQLEAMEADGLIMRIVFQSRPVRVEYRLTALGESLFPVVQKAHLWAIDYVRGLSEEQAPITDKMRSVYKSEKTGDAEHGL